MIIRFLRWAVTIVGVITIALFLYFNIYLYDFHQGASGNADLLSQLRFLKRILHHEQAAEKSQKHYPEGFIFIHSLYALAWCDAVMDLPINDPKRQEAMGEVAYSLQQMDSPSGQAVFNPLLPIKYGAFYRGWTAYVRGRYLQIGGRDSLIAQQFERDCIAITIAITETNQAYLESYDGLSWPADNVVCLAALSLYDRIEDPQFEAVRKEWLDRIKRTLLVDCLLIPHGYDLALNRPLEGARGSSQALILAFLPEIDLEFSQNQYQQFRKLFLDYKMGLPGIREFPRGVIGQGDIDSGPVVMGIGGVASIVSIRAARLHADWALAEGLRNGTSAILFPQKNRDEKYYLFGQLPILDAFNAWAISDNSSIMQTESGHWRWKFQMISIVVIIFLLWAIWKMGAVKH